MFDKELLALLGKDKKYVFYMVSCNLLTTVSNVVFAFALCRIFNLLILNAPFGQSYTSPIVMAAVALMVRFVLALLNGHFSSKLGTNAKEMLRYRIYSKVARLGVRETDELSLASLTQVGIEGVEQLDLYYSTYIPQFFYSVISPFILFAILMFISKPSAIILICCVPLIPMSIIAVSKYAKKIFARYWDQYTKMGDAFLDNISGMKELKIYGADERYHNKMNDEAEEFRKITMKVLTMQLASTTIMDLVAYGGAGAGIAVAIATRQSVNPIFSMETPALLLFVVLIAVDFFLPLRALGSAFHVSMNGATAGKKILTLLNTPEPLWGTEKIEKFDIEMTDVSFSYDGTRKILDNVSLKANKGELISIVGKSGCGKSTIISLMAGMRRAAEGSIKIGGKDISTLSRDDYYSHLGLVSYNTYLFGDTVRNNFRMAKEDITDEEIYSFLKLVNLSDFIKENGGLDLELKEGSVNISGGQRQRLAHTISPILIAIIVDGAVAIIVSIISSPVLGLIALISYLLIGPVLSLAALPANLTQTFASGDRILDFMEEEPVVNENHDGRDFVFENVEIKDMSFGYEKDSKVVDSASLKIERGDIVGIIGPSGCGKSTLLKLLLRFYDPDEGEIFYNGIPLKDIDASALHKNVVMVSQDTYLFDDTIIGNIRVAKENATLDEVKEACRKASIDEFIDTLPDGYETEVGLLGDSLSAGEKQRIGLARAFVSGASVILLDEVTSNVDAINEGIILKSLKDVSKDTTIILVSHRESTVSICSRVYESGKF